MINEKVLPNPFKPKGDHLDNVMAAIEQELDDYNHAPPTLLSDAFLQKLETEVMAACRKNPALTHRAYRIIDKLRAHWPR